MKYCRLAAVAVVLGLVPAGRAQAQVVQRNAQFRLPASYNFTFYNTYP